jgi:hypothetical protein
MLRLGRQPLARRAVASTFWQESPTTKENRMRAETELVVEAIRQSLDRLRRHL